MSEALNDAEAAKDTKNAGSQGDSPNKMEISPEALAVMNSPSFQRAAFLHSLPAPIRRRVKALKKLQLAELNVNAKFFEELHELECKYAPLYQPFREKRRDIVTGKHEPTDEECDFPSDTEDDVGEKLAESFKKAGLDDKDGGDKADAKGVPDFWLIALQSFDMVSEMIQEHDEPVLRHLSDIQCHLSQKPMGFKLEFYFTPNDYFTDSVLTKEYELRCEVETSDPWSFEGTEIVKATGCTIHWKEGKNITQKVVKKRQKHKSKGTSRMVEKVVERDSFFNFFAPPKEPAEGEEADDETGALLAADYEIGHYFKERLVPRATLFFTGDAVDQDDYEVGDEEDEEDVDGDDADSDPEFKPGRKLPAGQKPEECKQQ